MLKNLWAAFVRSPDFGSKAEAIAMAMAVLSVIVALVLGFLALVKPGVVVDGIDELTDVTREGVAATQKIAAALEPDDAIEALNKRGYKFSQNEFLRAIRNEDDRSISLFCTAAPRSWTSSSSFTIPQIPQASLASLLGCHASKNFVCDYKDLSTFSQYSLSDALSADAQHGLITAICGPNIVNRMENQISRLQNAERSQLRDECNETYSWLKEVAKEEGNNELRRISVQRRISELKLRLDFRFPGSNLPEVCLSEFDIDFEQVLTEL
ncbi:hypothetical protein PhaeoP30_00478 [Phaeobacter inhibens]|uniref:hypothetical protein n=1 Tax=Phaeobacter inhibens TaxID=221822 RepID=UPI000CA3806B|nr:hypothetical protein [Phaeobacter inhibens]AUQ57421.1 hypothetical protein PhaeoP30_00478 [Phaeobacter inhibens]